ncbi:unnamed protein product [Sphagnum troendelagicum]
MHDLRDTSLTRSENGRSSDCLSFQGSNANGIGASVPDEDTSPFHYPDRSTSNREKMMSHRPWAKDRDAQNPHSSKNQSIASGASLSDTHMASRRAEQAANRRMLAAMWLQEIVGVTSLSNEPSEEELRLCLRNGLVLCNAINKVQPGAVPKVVEIPPLSNHLDGAQSAYQYFENVRNFLVAVEEMGLPSFEASDLEQVSLCPSSSAKLVDCILALKAYHEWKQGGAMGFWRLKSPNHLMGYVPNSGKYVTRHKSMNSMCNQARRKWGHPDLEYLGDRDLSSPDLSANPLIFDRDSRASLEGMLYNSHFHQNGQEKRVNDEEADRLLKESHEPEYMKCPDDEELLALEKQKRELEVESKHRICTLELELQDAQRKMCEIEMDSASLETKYQTFLFHQAEEYKNLRSAQHGAKEEVVRMQMEWKCQLSSLEKELQAMARAASGYHKVLAENRALYNEVQDLKGNIRVYCRVRPFLSDEPGRPTIVDYIGENGEIVLVNPSQQGGKDSRKAFAFNKVFGTMASQEEVFMDTQPLIRSVLDGYNVCIFAYGQTGSGKTFTMNGPNNMTPFNWGVNYRALHDLFHLTQSRLDVFHYEIGVQMLEIYNEQVRDLLNTDGVQRKYPFHIFLLNGSNVPDASMMTVRSTEDVLELMKVGQKNRAVGATALNDRSSRSHSILTIHIQGTDLDSGTTLRGSLHLVDLAGSERVDKSEATGDRLKEAQHINKSLSALGDVIAALAQKSGHVPYRNSKLTQLLQDSLGGQAKTLMFVHVSPDIESFGETVSTLKFAERVSSVELGAARSNKESGEILNLRAQVAQLRDAASKKDAEIERLQALKDRGTPGESNLGNDKSKFKPFSASPHGRRMSTDPAVQRNHKLTMDSGGVVSEVRRSMNKLPGLPKWSRFLVPNTRHDSEDAMEHSVSPSVCSPVQSRTERKLSFEGSEELADKKLLKMRKSTHYLRQSISSLETHKAVLALKEASQQQEKLHSNHREITMYDTKCLSEHTAPQMAHVESIAKDLHDRCQTVGNKSVLASEGDEMLARHSGSTKIQHDAANSGGSHERTNRLKPPSNGVFSQQVSNGELDHLTKESTTDGQKNCGVFSNTSLYMLNDDVLDEHLENNGMFELQDNYQDDGGILLSESHLSVEIDLSLKVDQNKRLYSSSGQPRHERKALFETQIPCPPVKKSLKISPIRSLRRSIGGPLQAHPRRYTDVASVASTDKKPIAKGNISGRGNSAPEDELHHGRVHFLNLQV